MSDDREPQGTNPWIKSLAIWLGILLALVLFVSIFEGGSRRSAGESIAYSEFLNRVEEGSIKEVDIAQGTLLTSRYMRDKHITRDHLRAVAKTHPGFSYTFIMCGGFSEFALHPWFGTDIGKHSFTLYGDPGAREQQMTAVREYVCSKTIQENC